MASVSSLQRLHRPAAEPVVSVNLRPSAHLQRALWDMPFVSRQFRRHLRPLLGFYFLNIIAWVVALAIHLRGDRQHDRRSAYVSYEGMLKLLFAIQPAHCRIVAAFRLGAYVVFGMMILPLAMLVAGLPLPLIRSTQSAGEVAVRHARFSTRQMWGSWC